MHESALAIILGRAGSKGLPGKNKMPIAGRPCWQWTLDAAQAAESVARVVVSTNDQEIIREARSLNVEVVDRPPELCADSTPVDAAVRHAVESVDGNSPGSRPIVILYANVPVRPDGLIDKAVAMLRETGCDSVQSYAAVGKYHPWWMTTIDADGRVGAWDGGRLYHGVYRRQDLNPAHIPDGGVIAVTRAALFLQVKDALPGPHAFLGADHRGVVHDGTVIDIDAAIDAHVAEAILTAGGGA